MGKLYFIRHGQTDFNNGKVLQGRKDAHLNAKGLEQAQIMTQYMRRFKLDVIYSSPLDRAQKTAQPLAASHNLEYKLLDDLQEVGFGEWEGTSFAKLWEDYPEGMRCFMGCPGDFTPPGGESFSEALVRAGRALDYILKTEGHDKNIAIVTHGALIRVFVCHLLGMPLNNVWKLAVRNVAITTVNDFEGNLMVESIGDNHFVEDRETNGSESIV